MNEKIKTLALSSGLVSEYKNRLECAYMEGSDLSDDIQTFAELIIQECIDVHVDNYGIDIIGEALKLHFGVNE